jgi:hypothetical protein
MTGNFSWKMIAGICDSPIPASAKADLTGSNFRKPMSNLRNQLLSARENHQSARYPGDLADILPARQSMASRWVLHPVSRYAAAAATIVLLSGMAIQAARSGSTAHRWQALLPTYKDLPQLPRRGEMAGAVKAITPPQVPGLLMDAKQPLVSSGQFIVNIGKDIAHHADALFHMG